MKKVSHVTDAIGVAMFILMFGSIMLQTIMRYVFRDPLSWTQELSTIAFIWLFFWSVSFSLSMKEHVKIDIFYWLFPKWLKLSSIVVFNIVYAAILLYSLPAVWSYFAFLSTETTASLGMSFQLAFSTFFVFCLVVPIKLVVHTVTVWFGSIPLEAETDVS